MVGRARARGMRLVGPNSQGLANFGSGAVASFSTMFTEVEPMDGPVGIVSQSGAMSVIPYGLLRGRGIGVRHAHATGNDADVTVCELAAVVAEDPALKLLLLYLEGIPDPWHLAEAAQVARERGLPIVALKAGRTPAGQEAALSHTGALASEDRTVDAFLAEHGIRRARDMVDLVDSAQLYLKGWRPRGRRLVAISNSGAVCVLTADAASRGRPAAGAARRRDAGRAEGDPARLRHHHQPGRHHRRAAHQQPAVRRHPAADRARPGGRRLPDRRRRGRRRLRRRSLRRRRRALRRRDGQAARRRRAAGRAWRRASRRPASPPTRPRARRCAPSAATWRTAS